MYKPAFLDAEKTLKKKKQEPNIHKFFVKSNGWLFSAGAGK
jgi:hypothetical protein